jgi:ferritin-like metal-binding protein YciE
MKAVKENPKQNGIKNQSNTTATKAKPGAAKNLRDLLIDGLKDIYWAEKALTKAIPVLIKNASSTELVEALQKHLAETKNQVTKVEEIFAALDEKATAKKCDAMEGLIKEGEGILEETEEGAVRDAGIIAAAQKVEHYEIASYGTLATFAKTLGEDDAASLLDEILEEEIHADEVLSEIAEASINALANEEENEDEEEESEEDTDDDGKSVPIQRSPKAKRK